MSVDLKQQSVERVDYNGSRSYMTSYIQAKYNETEGLFAVVTNAHAGTALCATPA